MKKPKKVKVPPISSERQALFTKYGVGEMEGQKLHRELYETPLEKVQGLAQRQKLPWVDLEVTGNELIKWFVYATKERIENAAHKAWARNKWSEYFYHIFDRPLRDFWEGNETGLDVIKLDDELVKAPDGQSTRDAILAKHGAVAVQMIEELLHGIDAPVRAYAVPRQEEVTA